MASKDDDRLILLTRDMQKHPDVHQLMSRHLQEPQLALHAADYIETDAVVTAIHPDIWHHVPTLAISLWT